MSINVVTKGKEGEREICNTLLGLIQMQITAKGWDEKTASILRASVQRNLQQSAVGGGDINLLGISFEVKRQETLAVPAWWRQCVASAARNGDKPILIYRQNRKAWNVVMEASLWYSGYGHISAPVTVDYDTFKTWFSLWVCEVVREGKLMRI